MKRIFIRKLLYTTTNLRCAPSERRVFTSEVESTWNVMAHGDAREGKWRGNWRMEWVSSTLHTTSEHYHWCAHLGCPVVDWNDAPADLNGLVRFAERRNVVSARVPSHFKRSLTSAANLNSNHTSINSFLYLMITASLLCIKLQQVSIILVYKSQQNAHVTEFILSDNCSTHLQEHKTNQFQLFHYTSRQQYGYIHHSLFYRTYWIFRRIYIIQQL
jgi:hypothetical protein